MTDDAGWSARMSAKAKAREQARNQTAELERAEAGRPWREFVEARGGYNAHIDDGWFKHSHPAHGLCVVDARTGRVLGVPGIVVDESAPPPPSPEECPVCRDVEQFLDTIEAAPMTDEVIVHGWVDGEYHGSAARRLTDVGRAPIATTINDYWPEPGDKTRNTR